MTVHFTDGADKPSARSVADLKLVTQVLCDASVDLAHVHTVLPLPFRTIELPKQLKFGYYVRLLSTLIVGCPCWRATDRTSCVRSTRLRTGSVARVLSPDGLLQRLSRL